MNVGLRYSGIWKEIGNGDFLHAFFSTISFNLEYKNWGSKFPYIQKKLCFEKLNPEEMNSALAELNEIRTKFSELNKENIVWDSDDLSKKPPDTFLSQLKANNLSECFITVGKKNLFDLLFEVLEFCKKRGISVAIQNEKDIISNNEGSKETVFALNWGTATPEFYNDEKKSAVHIFNHCLIGEGNINRVIKFVIGRIEWYNKILPKGSSHEVVFDDRGQDINDSIRNKIAANLNKYAACIKFASKGR